MHRPRWWPWQWMGAANMSAYLSYIVDMVAAGATLEQAEAAAMAAGVRYE